MNRELCSVSVKRSYSHFDSFKSKNYSNEWRHYALCHRNESRRRSSVRLKLEVDGLDPEAHDLGDGGGVVEQGIGHAVGQTDVGVAEGRAASRDVTRAGDAIAARRLGELGPQSG